MHIRAQNIDGESGAFEAINILKNLFYCFGGCGKCFRNASIDLHPFNGSFGPLQRGARTSPIFFRSAMQRDLAWLRTFGEFVYSVCNLGSEILFYAQLDWVVLGTRSEWRQAYEQQQASY